MNIRQDNLCTFCKLKQEKIEQLFWYCNVVNQFGGTIDQWIFEKKKKKKKKKKNYMVNVDKYRALFGIPSMLPAMQPINYILIY